MQFVIVPAIVMGIVIGFLEAIFVHTDEPGMGWFIHSLHAMPFVFIFVFASMNVNYLLGLTPISPSFTMVLIARIVIGVIAIAVISAKAAIAGRIGEKFIHTLIIGILIVGSPYAWEMVLGQTIGGYLPNITLGK